MAAGFRRLQTPGGRRSKRKERGRLEKLRASLKLRLFVLDLRAAGNAAQQQQRAQSCCWRLLLPAHSISPWENTLWNLWLHLEIMLSIHLHSQISLLCQEAAKQCPLVSGLHEAKQTRGFEVSNFCLGAAAVSAGFNAINHQKNTHPSLRTHSSKQANSPLGKV